jgi:glycosyltransferase involved in cell wall biosynthesis
MELDGLYKVSICMATYNGEKFILAQLQSILCQLRPGDEIIISDDGSTDETEKIIKSLNDLRIQFVVNVSGRNGPVGNFQNSLTYASGDIIFLADQDDFWLPNKIEEHLAIQKAYDLVVSNAIVINEQNHIVFDSFFKVRNSRKGLVNNIIKNSYIGCCMSFKMNVAVAALPFPKNIHMHDWWIGLIAELTSKIYFHDMPLMYYKRHDNTASSTLIKTLPFWHQVKNRISLLNNLLIFKIHEK